MNKQLKLIFSNNYSENSLTDFFLKTKHIYEYLGYEFELTPIEKISESSANDSSRVWLNEKYSNAIISNVTELEFESPYPNLISKIANTNLKHFNRMLGEIVAEYNLDRDINVKNYINMIYGCIKNPKSKIYADNVGLVTIELRKIMDSVIVKFKNHVVYIDTDAIIFRNFPEIELEFYKHLNEINRYNLPYFIENKKFCLFTAKKNYMIEDNGSIKIHGIKHFSDQGTCRGAHINIIDNCLDIF